jgi:hypothetical protein
MCNSKNFVQQNFCGEFPEKSWRFSRRVIAHRLAGKFLKTEDAVWLAPDGLDMVGSVLG